MKRVISRHHDGKVVSNGAMGVPQLKRLPDNSTLELQRCNVPVNDYFHRLRGDPSLLPPVFHLRIFVLDGVCLQLDPDASSLEELRRFCGKYSLFSQFTKW